jgi:hypothetical protein
MARPFRQQRAAVRQDAVETRRPWPLEAFPGPHGWNDARSKGRLFDRRQALQGLREAAASFKSRRAAPVGSARPCSQFSKVRLETPSAWAKSACDSPERARAAISSQRGPVSRSSFFHRAVRPFDAPVDHALR